MRLALLVLVALAATPQETAALARAEEAATRLGGTLKKRVTEEMGKGGPASAVTVCSVEAPALAEKIRAETGVTVGRASLKLRNPANAPPPWVQAWLVAQAGKPAAQVSPSATVADGRARVLRPIAVEAPCLACHGPPEAIAPEVRAELARRYPTDAATGYAVGDLRGALWAEAPVAP
ncbi:MAG: Tll0287-like domain-containing protein [Myxococcota bacterium]